MATRVLHLAVLVALIVAVSAAAADQQPALATVASSLSTVPCEDVIGYAKSGHQDGYRVVLGIVSVPPMYLRQVVQAEGKNPWPYWRKAGLVIHAGRSAVTVSVPEAWRKRAAITWGNSTGIVSSLRIAGCPAPRNVWRAYAGGFYLNAPSACVPLIFQVGRRRTTVRFGVGQACGR